MAAETAEHQSSVEAEIAELETIQQEILSDFERNGINIDQQVWRALVPTVRFEDLESRRKDLKYAPDKIFALVESSGEVTFDREQFAQLGPLQKKHAMLHEPAHRIDWLLAGEGLEEMIELDEIISQLPPDHVSPYTTHLDKKYADSPERAKIFRQEAMAELIAHYWESNGSFRSFMEVRAWQGTGNAREALWAGISEADQLMAQLERFDHMSEDEQADFLEAHPDLSTDFQIYVNLRSIFSSDGLLATIDTDDFADWEYDLYEEEELVEELPPAPPIIPTAPAKKELPPKESGVFDPFAVFRFD